MASPYQNEQLNIPNNVPVGWQDPNTTYTKGQEAIKQLISSGLDKNAGAELASGKLTFSQAIYKLQSLQWQAESTMASVQQTMQVFEALAKAQQALSDVQVLQSEIDSSYFIDNLISKLADAAKNETSDVIALARRLGDLNTKYLSRAY